MRTSVICSDNAKVLADYVLFITYALIYIMLIAKEGVSVMYFLASYTSQAKHSRAKG